MEDNVTKAVVEILGERFTMKGGPSEEYMKKLADIVNKKMQQIANRNTRLSKSQIAILTALNIADDLQKLQGDYDSLTTMLKDDNSNVENKKPVNKNKNVKKIKQTELDEAHGF